MNPTEELIAHLQGILTDAADEADARARLRAAGCDEATASLYAAHHFGTHRGDRLDHATKEDTK